MKVFLLSSHKMQPCQRLSIRSWQRNSILRTWMVRSRHLNPNDGLPIEADSIEPPFTSHLRFFRSYRWCQSGQRLGRPAPA